MNGTDKPRSERNFDETREMVRMHPTAAADYAARDDYLFGYSTIPPLLDAFRSQDGIQPSQFSNCGESFCYLKIDGVDGLQGSIFIDRSQIEDALDQVLRSAKLGCIIGGGTGLRYSYVDFALVDSDQACSTICAVLRAGNCPKRSWIMFFDEDKKNKWTGVWDDTPAPP